MASATCVAALRLFLLVLTVATTGSPVFYQSTRRPRTVAQRLDLPTWHTTYTVKRGAPIQNSHTGADLGYFEHRRQQTHVSKFGRRQSDMKLIESARKPEVFENNRPSSHIKVTVYSNAPPAGRHRDRSQRIAGDQSREFVIPLASHHESNDHKSSGPCKTVSDAHNRLPNFDEPLKHQPILNRAVKKHHDSLANGNALNSPAQDSQPNDGDRLQNIIQLNSNFYSGKRTGKRQRKRPSTKIMSSSQLSIQMELQPYGRLSTYNNLNGAQHILEPSASVSPMCVRCPPNQTVIADRGKDGALVTLPAVRTCPGLSYSGRRIQVELTSGPRPGTMVGAGNYRMELTIQLGDMPSPTIWRCKYWLHVQVQRCPLVFAPVNGHIICTNGNIWGSFCYFRCLPNYKLHGSSMMTCEGKAQNVTWTAETPTCIPVVSKCLPLKVPENGQMKCTNGISLGSICHVSCRYGYKFNRSMAVECTGTPNHMYWNDSLPTCISFSWKCPNLTAPSHGVMKCTNGNAKDSRCHFACLPGYRLLGSTMTVCRRDGHNTNWTVPVPHCSAAIPEEFKERQCRKPRKPHHGLVHCETAAGSKFYPTGTICTYYCRAGYEIPYEQVGNGIIICLGTHWNITESQLACLPVQCTSPPIPSHGNLTCSSKRTMGNDKRPNDSTKDKSTYEAGTICQYQCKTGYALPASYPEKLTTKCIAPNWNVSSLPACEVAACQNPPSIANGHLNCNSAVPGIATLGTTCHHICTAGFVIPTSQTQLAHRHCLPNLQWNVTKVPECKNASIPQPSGNACRNKEYEVSDPTSVVLYSPVFITADGNHAEVKCSPEIIERYGLYEITCQAVDPELTTLASCKYTVLVRAKVNESTETASQCSALEAPVNGQVTCQTRSSKLHCKVQCRAGFRFVPSDMDLSKGYVECDMIQGQWDFQRHEKNITSLPDCVGELSSTVLQAPLTFQVGIENCSCHEKMDKLMAAVKDLLISYNREVCHSIQCGNFTFGCRVGNDSNIFALHITWILQAKFSADVDYDEVPAAEDLIEKVQVKTQKVVTSDLAFMNHVAEAGGDVWQDSYQQGLFTLVCQKPGYVVDPDTNKCFQCPTGTYEDGESCHMCPENHYQDETGQTKCKMCPVDTVADIGSHSKEACLNINSSLHLELPPAVRDQPQMVHDTPGTQCHPNPCLNGGTCIITRDSYQCVCTNSYRGKNCETAFCPKGSAGGPRLEYNSACVN